MVAQNTVFTSEVKYTIYKIKIEISVDLNKCHQSTRANYVLSYHPVQVTCTANNIKKYNLKEILYII